MSLLEKSNIFICFLMIRALPDPELVIASPSVASNVGLSEEFTKTESFLNFFSGRLDALASPTSRFQPWATPYALSIYGQEMVDNCPFKTGNGYGDGRAISIAEGIKKKSCP